MTDALLLDAIYAAPDDDAPRLVYADALLERGDPRGELIVRQCRGDAATDLVEQYGDAWLGELAPVITSSTFERGFLATVTLREQVDLSPLIGHPLWRTVRELRGSTAIAIHPSMTALRVLHTGTDAHWPELFAGTPRPITELHYAPKVEESWDQGGDVTATPHSGGVWTRGWSRDEFTAIAACRALPALRRLVLTGVPSSWFATVLRNGLLDRVALVESREGPMQIEIAGGLAAITVADNVSIAYTDVVIRAVQDLPAHLGLELHTGPRFAGRPIIERIAGARLRR